MKRRTKRLAVTVMNASLGNGRTHSWYFQPALFVPRRGDDRSIRWRYLTHTGRVTRSHAAAVAESREIAAQFGGVFIARLKEYAIVRS